MGGFGRGPTRWSDRVIKIGALVVAVVSVGGLALVLREQWFGAPPGREVVIVAVGDIACNPDEAATEDTCQQAVTAAVAASIGPELVLALGDTQYDSGELEDYEASYDRSWGRLKSITRPVLGNHETEDPDAAGYYTYFGEAAGDPIRGYYSFDVGSWHVVALNTECEEGCLERGSAQETWLREDLARSTAPCTLAYMHRPRFSSDVKHGPSESVADLWRALQDHDADVVLAAHGHHYERFAPMTPDGVPDDDDGLRSFVVGTGGKDLRPVKPSAPEPEVVQDTDFGVLKMTLRPDSYTWEFVAVEGSDFTDSGTADCRRS